MGYRDSKKIIFTLFLIIFASFIYFFVAGPLYFKKQNVSDTQMLELPDISIDKSFFNKIESLKNNTVTIDENSIVKVNPFVR